MLFCCYFIKYRNGGKYANVSCWDVIFLFKSSTFCIVYGLVSVVDTFRDLRYDTIRYDTIRYDTIRYDTIRYNLQYDLRFVDTFCLLR